LAARFAENPPSLTENSRLARLAATKGGLPPGESYLGRREFAEKLGVSLRTVDRYRALNLLPKPTRVLRGHPAWLRSTVESWLAGHAA
jgi:predicted DNA-binding transcriptional regulator AlpA